MLIHVPVVGSYSSALLSVPLLPFPPAIKTLPFWSLVAVCESRPALRLPVKVQLAAAPEGVDLGVGVAVGVDVGVGVAVGLGVGVGVGVGVEVALTPGSYSSAESHVPGPA